MQLQQVVLKKLKLPMKEPFVTSYGRETHKDAVIVETYSKTGARGYAECVAGSAPLYTPETTETAWHALASYFIPLMLSQSSFQSVGDLLNIRAALRHFRGHPMAKAGLEMSLWDLFSNEHQIPLRDLLGGVRDEIEVGISIGIQPDTSTLLQKIDSYLEQGFKRFKVKIEPGWDIRPLTAIRKHFGNVPLMADANSAYTLNDVDRLKQLDNLNLMMIEQPLGYDDLIYHARLQSQLKTPICLDESIHCADDVRKAVEIGACRVINLKPGRVGGFAEALEIHDVCREQGLDLWCGGMLETGIGRLHNIALTSLNGFTLPGDTAPSARYFEEDIIRPEVTFSRPGVLTVEPLCGVAERVAEQRIATHTVRFEEFHVGDA